MHFKETEDGARDGRLCSESWFCLSCSFQFLFSLFFMMLFISVWPSTLRSCDTSELPATNYEWHRFCVAQNMRPVMPFTVVVVFFFLQTIDFVVVVCLFPLQCFV